MIGILMRYGLWSGRLLVLLTPVPAASAKGGLAYLTALPVPNVARARGFGKRLKTAIHIAAKPSG